MLLRAHFAAVIFFVVGLRPCFGADSQWQFNLYAAADLASTNDRLLVVVQFDADCLSDVRDSNELTFYETAAVGPITNDWLRNRAVLVAENIGQPSNLTFENHKNRRPSALARSSGPVSSRPRFSPSGTSITWLCQPDGVVLSCFVGYPEDQIFLQFIASQATEIYQQMHVAPNQSERLRQWHLERVQSTDRELFATWLRKVPRSGKTTRERKISAAVHALAQTRAQRIRQRFGSGWSEEQILNLAQSFSQHASFEQPLIHLLLAEIPDAKLNELQDLLWSELTDTRFWKPDTNSLTKWLNEVENEEVESGEVENATKPIILRIPDSRQKLPRWPTSEQSNELQEQFKTRPASLADVAFVARELNVGPLSVSKRKTPTFFIAEANSKTGILLTRNGSKATLTKHMRRISDLSKQGK